MSTEKSFDPSNGISSGQEPLILAEHVDKHFGQFHVIRDVSTRFYQGEVTVIIGASGSGKSTFLRMLNRLERHDRGRIVIDGIELNDDQMGFAREVADRMVFFEKRQILEEASPEEFFGNARNERIRAFLGQIAYTGSLG